MSYIETSTKYNREERVIALRRFTADLAKAFGSTIDKPEPNAIDNSEHYCTFVLDDAVISVSKQWNDRDKVSISINPRNCKLGYNDMPRGDEYKLPSAKVSVDRPMATLVADIKRRVIEPSKAPIAKRREHAAKLAKASSDLASTAAAMRKQHPGLEVTVKEGATYSGSIYRNDLSGSVHADGSVSIDRIGSLTAEQFARLMQALYGSK